MIICKSTNSYFNKPFVSGVNLIEQNLSLDCSQSLKKKLWKQRGLDVTKEVL